MGLSFFMKTAKLVSAGGIKNKRWMLQASGFCNVFVAAVRRISYANLASIAIFLSLQSI
jgi:hypothetical protein